MDLLRPVIYCVHMKWLGNSSGCWTSRCFRMYHVVLQLLFLFFAFLRGDGVFYHKMWHVRFQSLQAISFLSAFLLLRKHWTQQRKCCNVKVFVESVLRTRSGRYIFWLLWNLGSKILKCCIIYEKYGFIRMEIFPWLNTDI